MKNWNIDKIVSAVIADDPDAEVIHVSLTETLTELKSDNYAQLAKLKLLFLLLSYQQSNDCYHHPHN